MTFQSHAATFPVSRSRLVPVVQVVAGSLILAASAQIATPFVPVPTTLQTYALLTLAALFGPRLATAMTVAYLTEGLLGLPVFATGAAGPLVFLGTTAGYLFAFPFAAAVVGRLQQLDTAGRGIVASVGVMLLGHAIIIVGGVAWLALSIGLPAAIALGATPFLVGSLVKSVLATVTVKLVRRRRA